MVGWRFKVCTLRNFLDHLFWLSRSPSGDSSFGLLALKILTVHATLQNTKELKRLQAVKRSWNYTSTRLPNLLDHFSENSHHGRHLCFGLGVVGPSIEDLRQSLPTKTLPVHVVQRVIGSMLQPLEHLRWNGIGHCGPYIPHLFLQQLYLTRNIPVQNSCYTWQYLHLCVPREGLPRSNTRYAPPLHNWTKSHCRWRGIPYRSLAAFSPWLRLERHSHGSSFLFE